MYVGAEGPQRRLDFICVEQGRDVRDAMMWCVQGANSLPEAVFELRLRLSVLRFQSGTEVGVEACVDGSRRLFLYVRVLLVRVECRGFARDGDCRSVNTSGPSLRRRTEGP